MSEEIFAFPRHTSQAIITECAGMTLRDWFAGQALTGYCARDGSFIRNPADVAKEAYADADAMLKAREVSKR